MAKVISAYRGYTAAAIKARATIPGAGDMSIVGTTVECSNITTAKIRNAIGAAINAVRGLSIHANVNRWSGFGPTARAFSGYGQDAILVNSVAAAPHGTGEFAGYNHSAITPGWNVDPHGNDYWINSGSQVEMPLDILVGEVNYVAGGKVLGVLTNSADNICGWGTSLLDDFGDGATLNVDTDPVYFAGGITVEQLNMKLKVYINDGTAITEADDIDPSILCRVPGTDDAIVNIKIKAASEWHYDATGTHAPPGDWVQSGGEGMNWTTGVFDIGMLQSPSNFTLVKVIVYLYDWEYNLIGGGTLWEDVYYATDEIIGDLYLGMINIPAYGYHVVVIIEETI